MITGLDHIGIALDNVKGLGSFLTDALGIELECMEEVPDRKLKLAFYPVGETHLELLEETAQDSTIAYFLNSRGNGLQHLAFRVDDIDKAIEYIKSKGIEFIEKEPQKGARGKRVIFIKPRYTSNVIIELCQ